jgi:hypothetical protein
MGLGEIGWRDMDWIDLARGRDKWSSCEHNNEPSCSIKYWEILE